MEGSPLWNVSSVFGALMMTKYAIRYTATAGRVRRNAYLIKYHYYEDKLMVLKHVELL